MSQDLLKSQTDKIDAFLIQFTNDHPNIKYIYGGVTKQDIAQRKDEHIYNNQPCLPNNGNYDPNNWEIVEIPNTHIIIRFIATKDKTRNMENKTEFMELIKNTEQYLINKLFKTYNTKKITKCLNASNTNGKTSQLGGNGVNLKDLSVHDEFKFYIFYSLGN